MKRRRRKPKTEFGRVVRNVIETDSLRVPHTNNGGLSKNRKHVLVASCMNEHTRGGVSRDPRLGIAKAISEALDPQLAPRPARTFADMTPEERAEMMTLYAKKDR